MGCSAFGRFHFKGVKSGRTLIVETVFEFIMFVFLDSGKGIC